MLGRLFHFFTGLHSFLIGLFPFYIPVYLYTIGLILSEICLFIAATGIGYCLTLIFWDRICRKISFSTLIVWSFFSEYLLLSLFFIETESLLVVLAGLANGIFNCSFWTIQRLLFVKSISQENSGRNFGNSQILVLVVLKVGIFLGGYFLEQWGFWITYLSSGAIVLLSGALFSSRVMAAHTAEAIQRSRPLRISAVFRFKDKLHSRIGSLPTFRTVLFCGYCIIFLPDVSNRRYSAIK